MKKLKEFITRDSFKTRERIWGLGILIGFLLIVFGLFIRSPFIVAIAIVVDALAIVYSLLAFRCPHCDVFLGAQGRSFNHCPQCGKRVKYQ